ncbi:uncharacterized protein [Ovis canadensis]|uniref:uncharacterized protein n=1 Tax=Ovis canadensis TaxID=37174 RepID=UPI003751C6FC
MRRSKKRQRDSDDDAARPRDQCACLGWGAPDPWGLRAKPARSLSASHGDPSVTCSRPQRPAPSCSGQKPTKRSQPGEGTLRRRDERLGLAYLRDAAPAGAPPGPPCADPRPGPPLLAAGPRSAFSAHSGPPLGRFRFRFLAESVEENESGSVQSLRGSRRGEGRTVRGGQPGAGEPEPQPAPGEMAVGPGLPCTAGSDEAGQQRKEKMDFLLL